MAYYMALTEPKTLENFLVDETVDEFRELPQFDNSQHEDLNEKVDQSIEIKEDVSGSKSDKSSMVIKSADESKLTKSSIKIQSDNESMTKSSIKIHSDNESNMTELSPRYRDSKNITSQSKNSTEIQVKSEASGSKNSSKNISRMSTESNDKTDSITRKVNEVLHNYGPSKLTTSALDSIDVKSVSSTNSSKFAAESDKFQQRSGFYRCLKFLGEIVLNWFIRSIYNFGS